ncbi:hypothetical protein Fmac_028461 [Flemingia macrophylla]|uniref:Aminotransferase-like plant mobile domain-containing protein n=1 Tax=Flemingia macrophylla TaxID=520843 RepID=A0ABD1L7J7_9FABA
MLCRSSVAPYFPSLRGTWQSKHAPWHANRWKGSRDPVSELNRQRQKLTPREALVSGMKQRQLSKVRWPVFYASEDEAILHSGILIALNLFTSLNLACTHALFMGTPLRLCTGTKFGEVFFSQWPACTNISDVNANAVSTAIPGPLMNLLRSAGFGWIAKFSHMKMSTPLVQALVERWRPETHTFHLPVVVQCFGLSPPPEAFKDGYSLRLSWLAQHLGHPGPNVQDPVYWQRHARAWICRFLGGVLFVDAGSTCVNIRWLTYLRDVQAIGNYAWGAAALSYLYRNLCRATNYDTKNFGGFVALLQLWVWERIPKLRPTVILPVDVTEPIGVSWTSQYHALPVVDNVGVIRKTIDCLRRRDADIAEQIVYYTFDDIARGLALRQLNIYDAADRYVEPIASTPHPGQVVDIPPLPVPRSSREARGPHTKGESSLCNTLSLWFMRDFRDITMDRAMILSQEAVHQEYPPAQPYFHLGPKYHVSPHHVPAAHVQVPPSYPPVTNAWLSDPPPAWMRDAVEMLFSLEPTRLGDPQTPSAPYHIPYDTLYLQQQFMIGLGGANLMEYQMPIKHMERRNLNKALDR